MAIRDGYVIANNFTAIDLEASPACVNLVSPHANGNLWSAVYLNCEAMGEISHAALTGNYGIGGVIGGDVRTQWQWRD
jgi:hypothetical protein